MSVRNIHDHPPDPAKRRKAALALFLLILAIYLLTGALRIDSGDGETMYQVTRSMIERQDFAIPPPDPDSPVWGAGYELVDAETAGKGQHGLWGPDGKYYTGAGLGWSLAAVPFYVLAEKGAELLPDLSPGYLTRASVTLVNTLALSLCATLLFLLDSLLYPLPVATFVALAYGFGSIAWAYARGTFSEPLVALGLLWAVYAGFCAQETGRSRWWMLAGLGLGGALLTRQAAAIMALPLAAWALVAGWRSAGLRGMLRNLIALGVPLVLAQGIVFAYNALRFGQPLNTGYEGGLPGSFNPLTGLYGMLASPGKGLPVFVPLVLLGLAGWPIFLRKRLLLGAVLLAMIGLQFAMYASTERAWAGGLSWGPRHLVPILAFCLLPIGDLWPILRRHRWLEMAAALLLAASLVIQLLGIAVSPSRHIQAVYARTQDLTEFWRLVTFTWADSPIPGQVRSLLETTAVMRDPESLNQLQELVQGASTEDPRDGQGRVLGVLSHNVPDIWFVYWRFLGIGTGWIVAYAAVLAGLAAWAGIRLWRLLT